MTDSDPKNNDNRKRQHYVPKFYLKRFEDNGRLSVYDFVDEKYLINQNPERFAAQNYYYDTNEEELRCFLKDLLELYPNIKGFDNKQFFEQKLSQIECQTDTVFKKIDYNPEALFDDYYQIVISCFLHTLSVRTDYYRLNAGRFNNIIDELITPRNITEEKAKHKQREKEGRDKQLRNLLNFQMMNLTTANLKRNYGWFYAEASEDMEFIISDNPAYLISSGFSDLCFPIGKKKAIVFISKYQEHYIYEVPFKNRLYLKNKSVFMFNVFQARFSQRWLFGSKAELKRFVDTVINVDPIMLDSKGLLF